MTDPATVVSRKSHRDFLQTALFVDDRALVSLENDLLDAVVDVIVPEELQSSLTDRPQDVSVPSEATRSAQVEQERGDPQDVNSTNLLVESLADCGVACAVLALRPFDEAAAERIARLARRTDLVILDWNFGHGHNSAPLIRRLLTEDSELGGRLRLIVVYTAEDSLNRLVDDLHATLVEAPSLNGLFIDDEKMVVSGDRFRIAFVRKPAAEEGVGLDAGIPPGDLVGRVLDEFDLLVGGGLLQQLAMRALSEVRNQAHHLLSRFDSALDPAFIGHRAQTSHRDAVLFSLELLGTELASLVRSSDISEMISAEMVRLRVEQLLGDRESARQWNGKSASVKQGVAADKISAFLSRPDAQTRTAAGAGVNDPSVSSFLIDDGMSEQALQAAVTDVEQGFALLSSLVRTRQHDQERLANPVLELGVVVCDEAGQYSLCIQPPCDSVRVKADQPKQFVFLPLAASEDSLAFHLMVWDNKPIALNVGSIGSSFEYPFAGDTTTKVVKARSSGGQRVFLTANGTQLRWIGTVRDAQVRRMVQARTAELTRVGLDEAFLMVKRSEF